MPYVTIPLDESLITHEGAIRQIVLREPTTDETEARRILRRLTAQVDVAAARQDERSFRAAMEA